MHVYRTHTGMAAEYIAIELRRDGHFAYFGAEHNYPVVITDANQNIVMSCVPDVRFIRYLGERSLEDE